MRCTYISRKLSIANPFLPLLIVFLHFDNCLRRSPHAIMEIWPSHFHLKPPVAKIRHILEDTCDFLIQITEIKDLPEITLLVSFDVVGLYPYIPHEEVLRLWKNFLNQREVKDISTRTLCYLATIILNNNFSEIGEEVYHQLLETSIGTKFAPTYANLFMALLEKKIFENTNFKPLLWLRYLDRIFCIWTEGLERLQECYQYINLFHPTIKFTM